jgi:beta-hydroxylase
MFYETSQFDFINKIEQNWLDVKKEFLQLSPENIVEWQGKFLYENSWGVDGWNVFALYALGVKLEHNCQLCPKTTELIEQIPGMKTAAFSVVAPNVHIPPHNGDIDIFYRCTLGLVIPENSGIKMGEEIRHWEEGKCLLFQDTQLHEAWNDSNSVKVILIIDFIKPCHYYIPYFYGETSPDRILAKIRFQGLKAFYFVGETMRVNVVEEILERGLRCYPVELWVIIQTPTHELLFVTYSNALSQQPQPTRQSVTSNDAVHHVLNFKIPPEMEGNYLLCAIYVEEGENPLSGVLSHRSNIAMKNIRFTQT